MGPRLFSRGRSSLRRQGHDDARASMGPRLFSRGRRPRSASCPSRTSSFNGAAALQPRKVARVQGVNALRSSFNGAAALQPRKAKGHDRRRPRRGASMGPRLFSRGRGEADVNHVLCDTLQWGRGSSAAEGKPLALTPARLHSFNGAAALQPRKDGIASGHRCGLGPLQWGRGSSAAEGSAATSKTRGSGTCFNGAAALQPRKESGAKGRGCRKSCFNGAAALQPRKAPTTSGVTCPTTGFNGAAALQPRKVEAMRRQRPSSDALQWGRGSSAAEGGRDLLVGLGQILASMGPRLFSRGRGYLRKSCSCNYKETALRAPPQSTDALPCFAYAYRP